MELFSVFIERPSYIKVSKQDTASLNGFINHLTTSQTLKSLNDTLDLDPNINYNILHDIIQSAKNTYMPVKILKFNKHKHKKTKWITQALLNSISFRDKLYKRLKRTKPTSPKHKTLDTNLKTYNGILKKLIRSAKKTYYENLFAKFKGDIKNTWKTINEILNRTKRKNKFPDFFKDGNNTVTGKLAIANHFNKFFTNIGPKLSSMIAVPDNQTFQNYLKNKISYSFKFTAIDTKTISEIIDNLAPKTSSGFDGISTKLIKTIKNVLIKPVTIIINQMIATGIFPDKLKIAKVTPVFKKDDETLFTNYRPISILPALSKIFEKVIFKQMYEYFQKKKIFYNAQYGFREGHSTEFAALELIDRITSEMDRMNTPISIFFRSVKGI